MIGDMIENAAGLVLAAELAVIHDLPAVGRHILQDVAGMGDDQAAGGTLARPLPQRGITAFGHAVEQIAHGMAHKSHVFKVNPGFRLVEEQQTGLLRHELQQFGSFDFAAGKARVDVPVQKLVEMHLSGHGLNVHFPAAAAQLHHLARGQAVDGGRTLEGHADAEAGALPHGSMGDVVALEDDAAARDRIAAETHERHEQGRLAGAVGAEEDEGFPGLNGEVDAPQNGRALHGYVEIANLKHLRFLPDTP